MTEKSGKRTTCSTAQDSNTSSYVAMEDNGGQKSSRSSSSCYQPNSEGSASEGIEYCNIRGSETTAAHGYQSDYSSIAHAPNWLTESDDITEAPHLNKHFIMDLIAWYRNRSLFKNILTSFVFVTACVVYADLFGLFWGDSYLHQGIELFLNWMDQHSVGALFAFVGVFVLTTLIFIPPFLMTFGAGFVFVEVYGFLWGIALAMTACFLGSAVGAVIAFARARYMTRDLVKLFARRYKVIRALDQGLKRSGFKVMLLLRLCSIIPFSALNYIGGVTGVTMCAFICSLIGVLPSLLLVVFFGATTGSVKNSGIAEEFTISNIIWLSITSMCGLLAVLMTIYFARKELKKEIQRENLQRTHHKEEVRSTPTFTTEEEGFQENGVRRVVPVDLQQQQSWEGKDQGEEWFWVWA